MFVPPLRFAAWQQKRIVDQVVCGMAVLFFKLAQQFSIDRMAG